MNPTPYLIALPLTAAVIAGLAIMTDGFGGEPQFGFNGDSSLAEWEDTQKGLPAGWAQELERRILEQQLAITNHFPTLGSEGMQQTIFRVERGSDEVLRLRKIIRDTNGNYQDAIVDLDESPTLNLWHIPNYTTNLNRTPSTTPWITNGPSWATIDITPPTTNIIRFTSLDGNIWRSFDVTGNDVTNLVITFHVPPTSITQSNGVWVISFKPL